ncbi:MAG TPA: GGDEF domain-containing protein [Solirubrobacteraceae bacterium]|nr:GGDEF domain-containing protein [Solirubrobacteraceae bacterium]
MSFRNRLTVFFLVLVILPMIVVAAVGFVLASDSEQGKTDARLSEAQRSASGLFREYQDRAEAAARTIARDRRLAAAIQAGRRPAIQRRFDALAQETDVARGVMTLRGSGRFETGRGEAVAPARTRLLDAGGATAGVLMVSVITAQQYATLVERVTGADVVVSTGDNLIVSTLPDAGAERLPERGEVEIGGRGLRITGFDGPGFAAGRVQVRLLAERDDDGLSDSALEVIAILAAALIAAFAFALTVSRSLQSQIQRLLDAARRMAAGDFRIAVPTEGNDEFAALGMEFNRMARELEKRLEELQLERKRLREAIRRVGQSFAKGLDRDAVLEIVVQTAVDGVGADCGRAALRTGPEGRFEQVAGEGDVDRFRDAISAAEAAALDAEEVAETELGDAFALSHPLRAQEGGRILGMLTVGRAHQRFSDGERELFAYLSHQAGVSIENVDLHETVQRQAVTDELTGLFNHRRFQEVMFQEVERAKRFGNEMGLIMLDIDNFKRVNDTYGHMQGDLVLREVARVLRESSREIDEPARYGGEEMAVALPGTDLDGAFNFAERVRHSIESLELPLIEGGGTLRVTASFGAAAFRGDDDGAADKDSLVAAADAALYRAKRSGKNRTVRAE